MTAITLNLLVEEQLAQRASARDPLKWAVATGVCTLALTAAIGLGLSVLASRQGTELARLRARWNAQVVSQQNTGDTFQATQSMAADFVTLNQSRPLCAPRLALIKDNVTDSIQLSQLSLTTVADTQQPAVETAEGAEENPAKHRRPPAPKNVERMVLRLDGKCTNSRPEIEVDAFIQTLRNNTNFSKQVDQIQLRSISRIAGSADGTTVSLPSASFVVECRFKEQK